MRRLKRVHAGNQLQWFSRADLGYCLARIADLEAENEEAWTKYEQARRDRADALNVKTKEGLGASEWLMRTGKAERRIAELEAERDEIKRAFTVFMNPIAWHHMTGSQQEALQAIGVQPPQENKRQ